MGKCVLPSPAISALSSCLTTASDLATTPTTIAAPTAIAAQPATVIATDTVIATESTSTASCAVNGLAECVPSMPIGRTGLLPHP